VNLMEEFLALDPERRRRVQIALCAIAVDAWEREIAPDPPAYHDSVVGLFHVVEADLPRDALEAVRSGADDRGVHRRLGEPLAALQDADLELADHLEFAWYSVYNLFEKYVRGRAIDDWLIVNQALSANPDPESWAPALRAAIDAAG
jgi:hypothetical protein